jgi:cytochrome c5
MKAFTKLSLAVAAAVLAPAVMAAAPAAKGGVSGEKIYSANCASCHGAGVLGAPKFGDKAAWAPRVKQGKEVLYTHALNGFKMMPAKGGNPGLKDDEVKAAIDYMAKS